MLIGAEGELETLWELGEFYGGEKFTASVLGGATRQESVRLGLEMVPVECDTVVIHDAARCCVTPELIAATLAQSPATTAVPVSDTLRKPDGTLVDRKNLYAVQTPQVFPKELLIQAHAQAEADGFFGTDDASLVDRLGVEVALAPGSSENIKVTTPEDLKLAEAILLSRFPSPPSPLSQASLLGEGEQGTSGGEVPPPSRSGVAREGVAKRGEGNEIRIGQGYDVHQLAQGRECWLGGVHFPEAKMGPVGHSDADVLLHAICDALLGAAGLGDIGKLFPDTDPRWKDADSLALLSLACAAIRERGFLPEQEIGRAHV